ALEEPHAGGDVVDRDGVLRFLQQHVAEEIGEGQELVTAQHRVEDVAVQHEDRRLAAQVAAAEILSPFGDGSDHAGNDERWTMNDEPMASSWSSSFIVHPSSFASSVTFTPRARPISSPYRSPSAG